MLYSPFRSLQWCHNFVRNLNSHNCEIKEKAEARCGDVCLVIPALRVWRQENYDSPVSPGYLVRVYLQSQGLENIFAPLTYQSHKHIMNPLKAQTTFFSFFIDWVAQNHIYGSDRRMTWYLMTHSYVCCLGQKKSPYCHAGHKMWQTLWGETKFLLVEMSSCLL